MKAPNQGILNRVKLIFYLGDFQASTYLENFVIKIFIREEFFSIINLFSIAFTDGVLASKNILCVFLANVV